MDPILAALLVLMIGIAGALWFILVKQNSIAAKQDAMAQDLAAIKTVIPTREFRACAKLCLCDVSSFLSAFAAPTEATMQMLRAATFCVLDASGHPSGCGVFVTDRIALTANHNVKGIQTRVSNAAGRTFFLAVVARLEDLDVAVLQVMRVVDMATSYLPLPAGRLDLQSMKNTSVTLIHGSIAWSNEHRPAAAPGAGGVPQGAIHSVCANHGFLVDFNDTFIFCDLRTFKGDSGASLLFRGTQLIGLHVTGFNDLDASHSEDTPSTAAESVRLDLQEIRSAASTAHDAWVEGADMAAIPLEAGPPAEPQAQARLRRGRGQGGRGQGGRGRQR